jgi:hypothetical protein
MALELCKDAFITYMPTKGSVKPEFCHGE